MRALGLVLGVGAVLAGCSPYTPDLGDTPFYCGTDKPACPDGFTCMPTGSNGQSVCTRPGAALPDAPPACVADPPPAEPNDMIANAFDISSVATGSNGGDFADFAICPAGDIDTYKVQLDGTQALDARVQPGMAGGALSANILGMNGNILAPGSPAGGGAIHAFLSTPPAGAYYLQIEASSSASSPTNTYSFTIKACTSPAQNSCM